MATCGRPCIPRLVLAEGAKKRQLNQYSAFGDEEAFGGGRRGGRGRGRRRCFCKKKSTYLFTVLPPGRIEGLDEVGGVS